VSRRVRAALAFLDILTLRPDDVGPADLDRARAEGLTDDAVRDVALVCALFSMITRLADTLNFAVPSSFDTTVRALTSRLGYRMPPPVFLLPRV
jgi:alkylhydroperoxidase family enzyme